MKETTPAGGIGSRWPDVLTIAGVLCLLAVMPDRIRLFPAWAPFAVGAVVIAPMAAVSLSSDKRRWLKVERTVTVVFSAATVLGTVANLTNLIAAMVRRSSGLGGEQLLTSSIGVWATNVLAFSLLYWQIDRGGPAGRASGAAPRPDWLFPQEGAPPEDVAPGWRPTFVDYLCLGFWTATAFSPTDALPMTARAKLLMVLESSISLATIVVVASRAINILGS